MCLAADFKSGFVVIAGKPNTGKSTLMNALVGYKLSIVSPKPQTTRTQVKGFINTPTMQAIFLDTPGFVEPRYELHEKMLTYIKAGMMDADVLIFITDAPKYPTDYDKSVLDLIKPLKPPKIALVNKIDLVGQQKVDAAITSLQQYGFEEILPVSAKNSTNLDAVIEAIKRLLPYGEPFYPDDEITDLPMRFFAAEIIREQIFLTYREEIPYASAVVIDSYKEHPNKTEINATIWVERPIQKSIVIGPNGTLLGKVRQGAEKQIHSMTGLRVVLHLWVKVKQNWRKKKGALKEFGYQ